MHTFLDLFGTKVTKDEARTGVAASLASPHQAFYERGDIAFEVPLEKCQSLLHSSYHLKGNHPFVETLLQYRVNPELRYDTSLLKTFYSTFQPATVLAAFVSPKERQRFITSPLNTMPTDSYHPFFPWDAQIRTAKGEGGLDASHGHQSFGPVSQVKGEMEFRRLTDVYESIKAKGYIPQSEEDGDIRGFFLRTDDDYRFVVRQGLHRTPALSVLGYPSIRAKFFKGLPRAIFLRDSAHWPQVESGLMSQELAEYIFMQFFRD